MITDQNMLKLYFNIWRASQKSSGTPQLPYDWLSIPEPSRIDPRSSEKYITFSSFHLRVLWKMVISHGFETKHLP